VFTRSRTLARIGGVPIQVDPTWFLIILLLAWSFWSRFTTGPPTHPAGVALAMAVTATALFALSVLAHELAHALEAKRRGVPVGGITLYLFGGATEILSEEVKGPGDQLALTIAGPWTSLVLGALFGLIAYLSQQAGLQALSDVFGELGWLNALLAVFNLLPGAPLDGGRVLAAVAWKVTGDRERATRIAARAGVLMGTLILAAGLWELFFVAAGLGGIWLAFIGWFLIQAARAEEFQAELRRRLAGVPAGRAATPLFAVPEGMPLAGVIENGFRSHHLDSLLVGDRATPSGVLTLDDVRAVPAGERARVLAGAVARPLSGLPVVDADAPAASALPLVAQGPVIVTRDGHVVGILTAPQLLAAAQRARDLERAP